MIYIFAFLGLIVMGLCAVIFGLLGDYILKAEGELENDKDN